MAQELTRIKETKRDFVVPVTELYASVTMPTHEKERARLGIGFNGESPDSQFFDLTNWSGSQLAQYAEIPKAYFDRIAFENPQLAAANVNHALERAAQEPRETRMLRILDGKVRGFLSPKYRRLDSYDLMESVLPTMIDAGMEIVSSEITERRFFLKALTPKLLTEVKKGDVVQHGLMISTSDVGSGALRVEPLINRLVCSNGMISSNAIRVFHIGKNQAEDEVIELLSDRTKELTDAALWSRVNDVVKASLKPEMFQREVDKLRIAANEEIKNFDLPRVVELTMKAVNVSGEAKKNSIIAALASGNEGSGLTRWGLINSFTRAAQSDDFSYEESIELERAAGQIIEMPRKAWAEVSAQAG